MWVQHLKVTLVCGSVKDWCRFLGSVWNMAGCYLLRLASDPREGIVCLSVSGDGCELRPSFSPRQMLVHVCERRPESYQHVSEKNSVPFFFWHFKHRRSKEDKLEGASAAFDGELWQFLTCTVSNCSQQNVWCPDPNVQATSMIVRALRASLGHRQWLRLIWFAHSQVLSHWETD